MEDCQTIVASTYGVVRQKLDKNAAAARLSRLLNKEMNGEAVRKLHVRGTCPAAGKYDDGRLWWDPVTIEGYAKRQKSA